MGPRKFYTLIFAVLLCDNELRAAPTVPTMALPGVPIESLFSESPPPQDDIENESLPKPQANRVEEGDYFEGDIRLRPGEDPYNIFYRWLLPRTARSLETSNMMSSRVWPGGRIPYKFHRDLGPGNTRITFDQAMREWENKTCIRFVHATDNDTDYLLLTDQNGYSSFVGRDNGEQEVSIRPVLKENDKKALGHAMHELGHAIGMWHEHSRRDRNEYVRINYENIKENKQINFGLLSVLEFEQVPNVSYDFESIMHYGPYAFSSKRGTHPTIEILDHISIPDCAKKMGQRDELSYKDILRANKLYRCHDKLAQMLENDCSILPDDPLPPEVETTTPPTTTPTPTPTPTDELTEPPVTCEVASMTPNERISTGAVITLNFCDDKSQAIECTIGRDCHRETCGSFFGCSTQQEFQIYFTEIRKNLFLKNGDTVVIRSRDKRHLWLDCTRGYCTITHDCSNNEEGYYNASNVSECDNHTFKVYSKHRERDNRGTLRTHEPLIFQHEENNTYLNCQDKKCKMVPEEGICEDDSLQDSADTSRCLLPQVFRIDLPES